MYDFSRLRASLAVIAALVPKVRTDVINLQGRIEALEAQADPTAQAQIDELAASAEQAATELAAVDALTPEIPPPG